MDNTSFDVNVIANGCDEDEIRIIEQLVALADERFTFQVFSRMGMERHYVVLDKLQEEENGDLFGFLDSDIMFFGDPTEDLLELLNNNAAIFSGRPIWEENVVLPSGRDKAAGRYMLDSKNYCIGGTYFALYKNEVITNIKLKDGVGFSNYWRKDLPKDILDKLIMEGQNYVRYDNGKVLNILMQHYGEECVYWESDQLIHAGGISRYNSVLTQDPLKMKRHKTQRQEQDNMRVISSFLSEYVRAAREEKSIPELSLEKEHFAYQQVKMVINEIDRLRGKYSDQLNYIGL
jgi:hypothetical protein